MKTTIQTSRGPVRFHSVGEPIVGIPASPSVDARLIASAPAMRDMLFDNLEAWEGEEDSVKEEHAELISSLRVLCAKLP